MTKPLIQVINTETGENEIREMNSEELTNYQNEQAQIEAAEQAALDLAALKASAKAKLIAGQPLTADEVDTLVI